MTLRIIALLAWAVAGFAQGPAGPGFPLGPPQPGTDLVKAFLTLTDSQIQGLQQLRTQTGDALQSIHQEIQQKQTTLQEQLSKGSTDAAALGKLLLDIEALRKRVTQTEETLHNQALGTLTAAQKAKLMTLEDAVKLQPVIGQAAGLQLLTPPQLPMGGPGVGPFGTGPRGPAGRAPRRFGPGGAGPRPAATFVF